MRQFELKKGDTVSTAVIGMGSPWVAHLLMSMPIRDVAPGMHQGYDLRFKCSVGTNP